MIRRAEWSKRALKEAARLDLPTRQRILVAIRRLCEESSGDVRRLQGVDELYRLRVGDWRVLFCAFAAVSWTRSAFKPGEPMTATSSTTFTAFMLHTPFSGVRGRNGHRFSVESFDDRRVIQPK